MVVGVVFALNGTYAWRKYGSGRKRRHSRRPMNRFMFGLCAIELSVLLELVIFNEVSLDRRWVLYWIATAYCRWGFYGGFNVHQRFSIEIEDGALSECICLPWSDIRIVHRRHYSNTAKIQLASTAPVFSFQNRVLLIRGSASVFPQDLLILHKGSDLWFAWPANRSCDEVWSGPYVMWPIFHAQASAHRGIRLR